MYRVNSSLRLTLTVTIIFRGTQRTETGMTELYKHSENQLLGNLKKTDDLFHSYDVHVLLTGVQESDWRHGQQQRCTSSRKFQLYCSIRRRSYSAGTAEKLLQLRELFHRLYRNSLVRRYYLLTVVSLSEMNNKMYLVFHLSDIAISHHQSFGLHDVTLCHCHLPARCCSQRGTNYELCVCLTLCYKPALYHNNHITFIQRFRS